MEPRGRTTVLPDLAMAGGQPPDSGNSVEDQCCRDHVGACVAVGAAVCSFSAMVHLPELTYTDGFAAGGSGAGAYCVAFRAHSMDKRCHCPDAIRGDHLVRALDLLSLEVDPGHWIQCTGASFGVAACA